MQDGVLLWQMETIFHFHVMMAITFQCRIISRELWDERLQRASELTFSTDMLYVIPTSERRFHSCTNETFDIQVQFEVQVSIIPRPFKIC